MAEINLLPEDLRKREEKEIRKLAKKPKVFKIELSQPGKNRQSDLVSSRPKPSLWSRIFGTRPRSAVSSESEELKNMPVKIPSIKSEQTDRRQKVDYELSRPTGQKIQKQPSFWLKIFGRPHSPILENGSVRQTNNQQPHRPEEKIEKSQPAPQVSYSAAPRLKSESKASASVPPPTRSAPVFNKASEKSTDYSALLKQKKDRLSWWQKLKAFFGGRSRLAVPEIKTKEADPALSASVKSEKKKSHKPEKEDQYHLAPRSDRLKLDINLVPEELLWQQAASLKSQIVFLVLTVIFSSGLVIGIYFFLDYHHHSLDQQLASQQKIIANFNQEIKSYQDRQLKDLDVQEKLVALSDILNQQTYWSNFFDFLEKYTLDGVYYTNFSADNSGQLSLPAIADDYQALARQIVAFRQAVNAAGEPLVKEVKVDKADLYSVSRAGIVGVSSEIKLNLSKGVFVRPLKP